MRSPISWKQLSSIFRKIKTCDSQLILIPSCLQVWKLMRNVLIKFSKTFYQTHLSLQKKEKLSYVFMRLIIIGDNIILACPMHKKWLHLRSGTQVLAFQKINRILYLRHSSKRKVLPAGNMEAPVLDYRSAAVSQI